MLRFTVNLKRGLHNNNGASIAVGNKVYCFGWSCFGKEYVSNQDQIGACIFNTVSLRWNKFPPVTSGSGERLPEVPPQCYMHTAVLIEGIAYIWGGADVQIKNYYDVLYAFDVDTHKWFKPTVSGTAPDRRIGHSACVLGKVMYIYGGYIFNDDITTVMTGYDYKPSSDLLYKLDTNTMVWSSINATGTRASYAVMHSATFVGTKMFVLEGATIPYKNIRVFDTETNCWLNMTQPPEEKHVYYNSFACNGDLCIFAVRNGKSYLLKFNPETFSWKRVEPKGKSPGSSIGSMCCCLVGDLIISFGGYHIEDNKTTYDGPSHELYILDLNPSLKTLCKLTVIQHGLEQTELTHNLRWELATMTTNSN